MPSIEPAPVATLPARKTTILDKLRTVLKDLSGQDLSGADVNASFLELGFDSLFLTQVAGAFRKEFGIKVTFRQLLEDFSTLDTLAGHLDAQLPPEVMAPAPPVAAPVVPARTPCGRSRVLTGCHVLDGARSRRGYPGTGHSRAACASWRSNWKCCVAAAPFRPRRTDRRPRPRRVGSPGASCSAPALPSQNEPKAFGPYKPIDKAPGGGLTERQQAHLDALIARYTARTPQSKRRTQETRAHLADPRTVSGFRQQWKEAVYPLVVDHSAGSRFRDIDGNEYVDLTMGFGTNLLGHSPAFVTTALEEQLQRGIEVGPQTPVAGKVAALLCELTGTERAAFTNTGSEAILAAVRLARTVTGRTRIATCGGFHGINDEVLVRANVVDGKRRSMPVAPGIPEHIVRDVLVVDYGTAEGLELLRAHAHELAAVLVEPVQSRRPDLQPREFLHAVREITQQAGCALVFDEIINGFRCHLGGAQAYFGVRADIVTYGKIIGGGMPIGAVCGKAEYLDALDGGMWQYGDGSFPEVGVTFFAGTYIRHPLTMAASWAVLNHLKREGEGLQRRLNERARAPSARSTISARAAACLCGWSIFLPFSCRISRTTSNTAACCFCTCATRASTSGKAAHASFRRAHGRGHRVHRRGVQGKHPGFAGRRISARANRWRRPARTGRTGISPAAAPLAVADRVLVPATAAIPAKPLQFSLYFFGNYPAAYDPDKYRLILEGSRYADQHDFTAIWMPERHFHSLGGFSPNSSVLAAALARDTERIALRGGSVVLPLHHPVRVAEEWSVVDNLVKGPRGDLHRVRLASERFHLCAGPFRAPSANLHGGHRDHPETLAR